MAILGGRKPTDPEKPILSQKGDTVYREGEADGGRTPLREDGSVIGGPREQTRTAQEAMDIENKDREHG